MLRRERADFIARPGDAFSAAKEEGGCDGRGNVINFLRYLLRKAVFVFIFSLLCVCRAAMSFLYRAAAFYL